eukprot:1191152-Prorocentrum_minimum.AAC.3
MQSTQYAAGETAVTLSTPRGHMLGGRGSAPARRNTRAWDSSGRREVLRRDTTSDRAVAGTCDTVEVESFDADVKGYGADVKGYDADVEDYDADVEDYDADVEGYDRRSEFFFQDSANVPAGNPAAQRGATNGPPSPSAGLGFKGLRVTSAHAPPARRSVFRVLGLGF